MDIKKCKECEFHRLDTLVDGTKEHYCYPPMFRYLTAPCKRRKKKQCNDILKQVNDWRNQNE